MRVTHFLGTLRPNHDGVTRVAYRLREGFREGFNQHLFVSPDLPDSLDEDMRKVPSIPLPLSTGYRLSVCTTASIRAILEKEPPDIIHMHTPCTLGRAAILAANELGIPVVATYHTHFPTYLSYYRVNYLRPLVWRYLRFLYNRCDAVIIPSQTTLHDLQENGIQNLCHIPHGVDTRLFSPSHRNEEWRKSVGGTDKIIVSFVGRLVWEKNLRLLAETYHQISNKEPFQFVIVGDGPAREKLQEMMPGAHFTGFLGPESLPMAYASSDLFVFPSVTETFGNVTVEAMASGLPAICAAAGGACDIVKPGLNGLLPAPNPTQFARAIEKMATQADYRKQLSLAATLSATEFSWESTVKRYESLYEKVVQSRMITAFDISSLNPRNNRNRIGNPIMKSSFFRMK